MTGAHIARARDLVHELYRGATLEQKLTLLCIQSELTWIEVLSSPSQARTDGASGDLLVVAGSPRNGKTGATVPFIDQKTLAAGDRTLIDD